MRDRARVLLFATTCYASTVLTASAQQTPPTSQHPVAKLEEHYDRLAADLDKKKLADLMRLAASLKGIEAEQAYRAAFDLAVHRGLYTLAEPAALEYLDRKESNAESQTLAGSIVLISEVDRDEYDKSLVTLKTFLEQRATGSVPEERRLPGTLVCALGEAYLQRLIRGGRIDTAREASRIAAESQNPDPIVRGYFIERLARLDMIGKIAPSFAGKDIDGKAINLSDLKGKVVLVDFWASWCPPCVASFPQLRELQLAYKSQGFAVIGINLDSLAADSGGKRSNPKEIRSTVRWFLLNNRASWTNILGDDAEKIADAYHVNEVPANFLIGRDGTIKRVELSGSALAQAIAELTGSDAKD